MKEVHKDHSQKLYDLTVHTLDTEQHSNMYRYLLAYILCHIFGFDYDEMGEKHGVFFIKGVAHRVATEKGIREIWLQDLRHKYDPEHPNWWEGRYVMIKSR